MSAQREFVWRTVAVVAVVVSFVALGTSLALVRATRERARELVNETRTSARNGCERGKLDRTMIAGALRAQSDYLNLVLDAKSVREDVKRAAAVNQRVQDASAANLETRTGDRLVCAVAFPPLR